jgi:hypothetical protein
MDIKTMFSEAPPRPAPSTTPTDPDLPWDEPPPASDDFQHLVALAEPLVARYDDICSPEWQVSPIGWIRQVSSALKRGKIGEELVMRWARAHGLDVEERRHRGHDCVIEGLQLEVKTSLRWNNDRFTFLNLRDFNYDAVALLALAPNDVALWFVPKQLLLANAKRQLRGASILDTKWLSFFADDPPPWMKGWGGSFAQAATAIHEVAKHLEQTEQDKAECQEWEALYSDIDWPWQPLDAPLPDCGTPQPASPNEAGVRTPLDTSPAAAQVATPFPSLPALSPAPSRPQLQLLLGGAHAAATANHEDPPPQTQGKSNVTS